jgi:hypothetical protein
MNDALCELFQDYDDALADCKTARDTALDSYVHGIMTWGEYLIACHTAIRESQLARTQARDRAKRDRRG